MEWSFCCQYVNNIQSLILLTWDEYDALMSLINKLTALQHSNLSSLTMLVLIIILIVSFFFGSLDDYFWHFILIILLYLEENLILPFEMYSI